MASPFFFFLISKKKRDEKGLHHVNVEYLPCNASEMNMLVIPDDWEWTPRLGAGGQQRVTFVEVDQGQTQPIEGA
jgi:hypothetical protein